MILKMPMIVGNIPERKNAARCPMSSVMRENLTSRISLATSVVSWIDFISNYYLYSWPFTAIILVQTAVSPVREQRNFQKTNHLHRLPKSCSVCTLVTADAQALLVLCSGFSFTERREREAKDVTFKINKIKPVQANLSFQHVDSLHMLCSVREVIYPQTVDASGQRGWHKSHKTSHNWEV